MLTHSYQRDITSVFSRTDLCLSHFLLSTNKHWTCKICQYITSTFYFCKVENGKNITRNAIKYRKTYLKFSHIPVIIRSLCVKSPLHAFFISNTFISNTRLKIKQKLSLFCYLKCNDFLHPRFYYILSDNW